MEENLHTNESKLTEEATVAQTEVPKQNKIAQAFKGYFTATRICYLAAFTALACVMYLTGLEFSLFPAVNFLKIDFSNVFVMLAGFSLGPVAGVIVCVIKELLHALILGQTSFVGELANVLLTLPYLLVPAIVYKKRKGIKTVIVTLLLGCLAQCIVSVPVSYLITFPAYVVFMFGGTWESGMQAYLAVWYWAVLFNVIKTLLISIAVFIVYKPLSKLIKLTAEKFERIKAKKSGNE